MHAERNFGWRAPYVPAFEQSLRVAPKTNIVASWFRNGAESVGRLGSDQGNKLASRSWQE
jgi:hypothetical protein